MNNATAATLAILIVVALLADLALNDAETLAFLGRRLIQFTEYLAFWR